MNKKLIILSVTTSLLVLPGVMLAFDPGDIPNTFTGNATSLLEGLVNVIFTIVWLLAAAFFVIMFILAGFAFANARGNPEKVKEAGRFLVWGIVGAAVAILAFSILPILRNQLAV